MNRQEAHKLMLSGKKITHKDFMDNEYLQIKDIKSMTILTEDGYSFTEQFWTRNRLSHNWREYND